MPWRCPACQSQIQHAPFEERPSFGVRYRCHVCRLELVLDPVSSGLAAAPVRDDGPEERERPTS